MKRLLILAALLLLLASCAPAPVTGPRIAVAADSMFLLDPQPVRDALEDVGTVVAFDARGGRTTWTHETLPGMIGDPSIDVVVVTFGLNETQAIRDNGMPMWAVLASWQTVLDQAHASGQCVVWTTTQRSGPLGHPSTRPIIDALNAWIRSNVDQVAEWGPTADEAVRLGLDWFEHDDGFHPLPGSWAPHAQGIKVAEAAERCPR